MSRSAPPQDATSVITQEFFVEAPCPLSVDVPGAITQIRPHSATDRAEVTLSVSGCSSEEAERLFDRLKLDARQVKGTVQVTSDRTQTDAEWWRWIRTFEGTLHVDVRCPSPVEADLTVPGGEIDVADLEGQFDLSVMGSPCRLTNLEGRLSIRAESSEVSIDQFVGDELLVRVAVGSLTLNQATADTVTLRSVAAPLSVTDCTGETTITTRSAPVTLEDLDGPCTVRSRGGSLQYDGCPTADTELDMVGGSLLARVPNSCNADLKMSGPTLTLDEALSFEGERTEQEISGILNAGGVPLLLSATGGPVECQSD